MVENNLNFFFKYQIWHLGGTIVLFYIGFQFIDFSNKIIASNKKTKGEFYVIPVYQEYINDGHFISTDVADEMWDLGTPESAMFFEKNYHKN